MKRAEDLEAWEILLMSMDTDGVKTGYDIPFTTLVVDEVDILVIASGGAGTRRTSSSLLATSASAALAASIFHYNECSVGEVKEYLRDNGIVVR